MRNLKRVLSLTLAALMLMGMMVVGAGAASKDFTDASEIKNVEAVDVMVALGILEGGDKGDFQPNSILTREQAAKIICYMLLGEEAAEKLTTNYAIFSDVPANRWSAPYISYCVNLGILAGDGAGHFYPEGKLTGVAFAKMLLVCLGYNATRENYVGNNWEINTSAAAISSGIAPKALDLSKELSRQDAAQMAFNTLQATMVEYLNDNTIIVGNTTVSTVGKATAVKQSPYTDTLNTENLQFAEKYFGSLRKYVDDRDAFERPATTWRYEAKLVGTYMNEPTLTYTAGVELGDIYADLGLGKSKTTDEHSVDGKTVAAQTMAKRDATKLNGSGNGVLTQVWYNDETDYLVITHVNTYVGKVNSVSKATSTSDRYVTLNALTNPGALNTKFTTENFAAQDLVTYTASWNSSSSRYDIQTVAALEKTATGILTQWKGSNVINTDKGTSNANFTVDGTLYNYSKNNYVADENGAALTNGIAGFEVNKSEINVYLDQYGYAIYVSGVEAPKNYAAVIGVGKSNQYGSETRGVTLLMTDGTQKEVIAKMDNWSDLTGWNADTQTVDNLVTDGKADLVTYTVDDNNVYKLAVVSSVAVNGTNAFKTGKYDVDADNAGTTFTNGKSQMTIYTKFADVTATEYTTAAVGTYYTTSETIFMVATPKAGGGYNYNVYTGYANAPGIAAGADVNGMAFVMDSYYKNQIDVVYIDATKMAGISGVDTFFVKDGSKIITDSDGRYYVFPAIVDGKETTIKIDPSITQNWNGSSVALKNANKAVYAIDKVVTNSKGIITSCDLQNSRYFTAANGTQGTVAANQVVLGIGSNKNTATYLAYNKDTKVYYVDQDYKGITVSSIESIITDGNDLVYAAYDSANKVLTDVIVVEVPDTVTVTYGVAPSTGVKFWNGSAFVTSLADIAAGTTVYVKADDATMKPVINGITLTAARYETDGTRNYSFEMPKYNIAAGAFTTTSAGYAINSVTLAGGTGEVAVTITGNTALTEVASGKTVTYEATLLRSAGGTGPWMVAPGVWNASDSEFTGVTSGASDGFKVQVTAKINGVAVATFESNGYLLNIGA